MALKTKMVETVELRDWDKLVSDTYGRVYSLQQQDGCMDRQTIHMTVPYDCADEEAAMHDSIPEEVNGNEMGVKFSVWLARDPKMRTKALPTKFDNSLFWERNFYPLLQTVANDLHSRGLLDAGNYAIEIDW